MPTPTKPNCPFYGRACITNLDPQVLIFIETEGNQCGAVTGSHSPCYMEVEGNPVDWTLCSLVG